MKALRIFQAVFLLVGTGALGIALVLALHTHRFIARAAQADGEVIELVGRHSSDSDTYAPVVRYTPANGEPVEFTSSSSSNPPAFAVGEHVRVLYLPGEPGEARIDAFFNLWGAPLILGSLGLMFFGVGAGITLYGIITRRRDEQLRSSGRPVLADYEGVRLNTSVSVNGRNPYRVLAQWRNPETARVHVFESHNLWYDPTRYMDRSQLTVYLDPRNPGRYYVDLSFLPQAVD